MPRRRARNGPRRTSRPQQGLTRIGVTVGTSGYMSPEQVRREELDGRSDLFSLGLVLYEMATGLRAFTGDTAVAVQEAILNTTPPAAECPERSGASCTVACDCQGAREGSLAPLPDGDPTCGTSSSARAASSRQRTRVRPPALACRRGRSARDRRRGDRGCGRAAASCSLQAIRS